MATDDTKFIEKWGNIHDYSSRNTSLTRLKDKIDSFSSIVYFTSFGNLKEGHITYTMEDHEKKDALTLIYRLLSNFRDSYINGYDMKLKKKVEADWIQKLSNCKWTISLNGEFELSLSEGCVKVHKVVDAPTTALSSNFEEYEILETFLVNLYLVQAKIDEMGREDFKPLYDAVVIPTNITEEFVSLIAKQENIVKIFISPTLENYDSLSLLTSLNRMTNISLASGTTVTVDSIKLSTNLVEVKEETENLTTLNLPVSLKTEMDVQLLSSKFSNISTLSCYFSTDDQAKKMKPIIKQSFKDKVKLSRLS